MSLSLDHLRTIHRLPYIYSYFPRNLSSWLLLLRVPMLSARFLIADKITVHCPLLASIRVKEPPKPSTAAVCVLVNNPWWRRGVRRGRNLGTGFAFSKAILGSSSVFSLWLSYRKTMHARIMEMWITPAEMTEKASRGQTPPGERRLHDLRRLKPLPLLSAWLMLVYEKQALRLRPWIDHFSSSESVEEGEVTAIGFASQLECSRPFSAIPPLSFRYKANIYSAG